MPGEKLAHMPSRYLGGKLIRNLGEKWADNPVEKPTEMPVEMSIQIASHKAGDKATDIRGDTPG